MEAEAVHQTTEPPVIDEIPNDRANFATPQTPLTATPDASASPASTPDLTPSRRSSRKKQSTFSSDFEYYTPGGRKIVNADDKNQGTSDK